MHVSVNQQDLSDVRTWMRRLEDTIETKTIPTIADSHKASILDLTASGFDAYGYFMHDYSPKYKEKRIKANKRVDVKDLSFTGDMLASLELQGDALTVGDKFQEIALGQMTGHDGDWGYEHIFLETSPETDEKALDELDTVLNEELGFS